MTRSPDRTRSPYAFQASVFTGDIDTALRASRRLDASAVMVNDHPAFRVDWMPFAGLRESGSAWGGNPLYDERHADQEVGGRSVKGALIHPGQLLNALPNVDDTLFHAVAVRPK